MTGNKEKQESTMDDRSSIPSAMEPLSKEELQDLLERSRKFSREAAASARSLGILSDSDLRVRLR